VNQILASDYNYLIVGGGATGLSAARFLHSMSKQFRVFDTRDDVSVLDAFGEIDSDVELYAGTYNTDLLGSTQEVILSPGVSRDEAIVQDALALGIPVRSDISLFLDCADAPVIGITGTNGKSTVTTMVGLAAEQAGIKVKVGGNLGVPALDLLDDNADLYVLELSSFQLESTDNANLYVAANLNVSPDHIDRHKNLIGYFNAKQKIFHGAKHVVYKLDDRLTQPPAVENVKRYGFGLEAKPEVNEVQFTLSVDKQDLYAADELLQSASAIKVPGLHNVENALAVYAICDAANISRDAVKKMLAEFSGLKHRCQLVSEKNGITYINDSKSTNVGSVVAALEGFVDSFRSIIWIAGGVAKGADFSSLSAIVNRCVKHAVVFSNALLSSPSEEP